MLWCVSVTNFWNIFCPFLGRCSQQCSCFYFPLAAAHLHARRAPRVKSSRAKPGYSDGSVLGQPTSEAVHLFSVNSAEVHVLATAAVMASLAPASSPASRMLKKRLRNIVLNMAGPQTKSGWLGLSGRFLNRNEATTMHMPEAHLRRESIKAKLH